MIGNWLLLLITGILWVISDWQVGAYQNWLYRPGGDLLSLGICSSFLLHFVQVRNSVAGRKKLFFHFCNAIIFAISWIVLSDLIVLVLERFFRFEEHLQVEQLLNYWKQGYHRVLWGLLLYTVYRYLGIRMLEHFEVKQYQQHLKVLRSELSSLNLLSLRRELNPHFLHNAMNSISMMVRIKKYNQAIEMIANLNDFLRAALSKDTSLLIPLAEELRLLDQYLKIEMARFGDRVSIEKDIEPKTTNLLVPQLILQPIVENVFKHGMQNSVGPQNLLIRSMLHDNFVVLSIMNTSDPSQSSLLNSNHQSIGLKNTSDRLRYLYGNDFKFQLLELNEGYNVRITIPCS
ncbi:MAG: histidine kinase [Bacteroidota bacterium]